MLMITFIIFTHWKKGSERWKKCAPAFFLVIVVLDFLLIPLVNAAIIFSTFVQLAGYEGYFNTYLLYFFIVFSVRIV